MHYVGLDASKATTKICVIDEAGAIVKEAAVETDPRAIVACLRGEGRRYRRIGMEAWAMAPWIYAGLAKTGLPIICIEAWDASGVLKARRRNKTDRNDARGIAEMMRFGLYKTVHIKTVESQNLRALLTARKLLRTKAIDIENAVNAALLIHGLKSKTGRASTFERRIAAVVLQDQRLLDLVEPLLRVRRAILEERAPFERRLEALANDDAVCRRLMTAPGVGPIVALTYRVAIDEPARFRRSRDVGAHLGLTPLVKQSGTRRRAGEITKSGDKAARAALFLAARHQFRKSVKPSWLKTWGDEVAARHGRSKAMVAIARRLAVTLHQMWVTETDFRWSVPTAAPPLREGDYRAAI
jgi:transposase